MTATWRLATLALLLASAAAVAAVGFLLLDDSRAAAPAPVSTTASPAAVRVATPPSGLDPPAAGQRAVLRHAAREELEQGIDWRRSRALGATFAGTLVDGVKLPHEGVNFFTWDPVAWKKTNQAQRRYATDRLVRTILRVADAHAAANPGAPRMAVGDLSRPEGGRFDARHGVLQEFGTGGGARGHASHQNGLDVDVYYPRKDGRERGPASLDQIDVALAQDIVDRFVAAGAELVLVGPRTGLMGPPGVVAPVRRHDDHMHVRLPAG